MKLHWLLLWSFTLPYPQLVIAQTLPCQRAGSEFFTQLLGEWRVEAKDRLAPGDYEENSGRAVISWGIEGCSLQESYLGTFKQHPYAVKYETYLSDSLQTQRTFFDSEHSNLMFFQGIIEGDTMSSLWLRDLEKKRMQVKNELKLLDKNSFQNTTYLSTDYGQTWQLTHAWQYTRKQ